jgi:hypothetical protein
VQLAQIHSHPHHAVKSPLDRLDQQEEARVTARVTPPGFHVAQLRAARRTRRMPNLGDASWEECSDLLTPLIGLPIVPGLSRRVRDLLQNDETNALVRDALLQLAPGHIQILAAITDRWFVRRRPDVEESSGGDEEAEQAEPAASGPPVGAIGGMVDSCYMWRSKSPLIAERERVMSLRLEAQDEESD